MSRRERSGKPLRPAGYWMELATDEKTLFAFVPIRRTVPITMTRMTASMTAYSAMSWPCSFRHKFSSKFDIRILLGLVLKVIQLGSCTPKPQTRIANSGAGIIINSAKIDETIPHNDATPARRVVSQIQNASSIHFFHFLPAAI
jgi:hypothetical protein